MLTVNLMRLVGLALATVLLAGATTGAAAQTAVTSADIQRLQDTIYDISRDLGGTRTRDRALASQLEGELDDARDEATYLKVKLRKSEPVTRAEYTDLRERIDGIRLRARSEAARASIPGVTSVPEEEADAEPGSSSTLPRERVTVPVGTEFDVRLQKPLSSETAQVEDRFEATTVVDYTVGDRVVVPAGSLMRGIVSSVTKAGRIER